MHKKWGNLSAIRTGEIGPNLIAAQPAVPVKVAANRWFVVYSLLDLRGHDSCSGVIGELRENLPTGKMLQRLTLSESDSFSPFGDGLQYFKCTGQGMVFGSEKTGVFVVKHYVYAHGWFAGKLINPGAKTWPGIANALGKTLRIVTMQLEYAADRDEMKITVPSEQQKQLGWENDPDAFCNLGPQRSLNQALTPPVPIDQDGNEFVEVMTMTRYGEGIGSHGTVAPVRWRFNAQKRKYEWVETGSLWNIPGFLGEVSLIPNNKGDFIASMRNFATDEIVLARSDDLFKTPANPRRFPNMSNTPRTLFLSAGKVPTIFTNLRHSPYNHTRNPLYEMTIQDDLALSSPELVFDAIHMPFVTPFVDMAKAVVVDDDTEQLLFRMIDKVETVGNMDLTPATTQAVAHSGVYCLTRSA